MKKTSWLPAALLTQQLNYFVVCHCTDEQGQDLCCSPPEVHEQLLSAGPGCFLYAMLTAIPPHSNMRTHPPPRDEPHHSGVISKLGVDVTGVSRGAVAGVESEE